jgi:4-hydroxyphenylpyruvate dioxygenase
MILNINQSFDKNLTLVISEASEYSQASRVQRNINTYGPGIHHLAFATRDLVETTRTLVDRGIDFVTFPSSYYELLRDDPEFQGLDIAMLEANNILVDKEGDTYLLQKFIKPLSDRPFFIYEIVQRVNGYQGFALRNINVLKRAEELQIMEK